MGRWVRISSFAVCLLASSGLHAPAGAQDSFIANQGAQRLTVAYEAGSGGVTGGDGNYVTLRSGTITVPAAWAAGRIVARFSSMSRCIGPASFYCSIRMLVNETPMKPNSGLDYAFDDTGPTVLESNSVERTSAELGPGTYTVAVQGAVVGAETFIIDDSVLTLTLWRVR